MLVVPVYTMQRSMPKITETGNGREKELFAERLLVLE